MSIEITRTLWQDIGKSDGEPGEGEGEQEEEKEKEKEKKYERHNMLWGLEFADNGGESVAGA